MDVLQGGRTGISVFTAAVSFAALAIAVVAPSPARADVNFFHLFKAERFEQASENASPTPASWDCIARIDASDDRTLATGTVTFAGPASPARLQPGGQIVGGDGLPNWVYLWSTLPLASRQELERQCPSGRYVYAIAGGTLGTATATLSLPASTFTGSVPAVDAASWRAIQAFQPGHPLTIGSVGHTSAPGAQFSATYVTVRDTTNGSVVAAGSVQGASPAQVRIPAGTLVAGRAYEVSVAFTDRYLMPGAGFGTGESSISFDRTTSLTFPPGPEDGGVRTPDAGDPAGAGGREGGTDRAEDGGLLILDAGPPLGTDAGGATGHVVITPGSESEAARPAARSACECTGRRPEGRARAALAVTGATALLGLGRWVGRGRRVRPRRRRPGSAPWARP